MSATDNTSLVRFALPKGRMQDGVFKLLEDAGIRISRGERAYRPRLSMPGFEAKLLKPQSIIEMLSNGSRDVGFAGTDWVKELDADVVELLDTGLDPVRLVAAAPRELLENGSLPKRHLVIASEYKKLTADWISSQKLDATFVLSYGATEVFPPEDADLIVDNTATGSTLDANNLLIVDELMRSSTKMYANKAAMENAKKRDIIETLVMLVRSVIDARARVMVEVNVSSDKLDALTAVIPAMRAPTISGLSNGNGFVVKAAVPRKELTSLIPKIKQAGGTDIVVSALSQIVP